MDLRHLEDLVKEDSEGGVLEKKRAVAETLAKEEDHHKSSIDSAKALQLFLDHITISSSNIVIKNPFPEVEAKTTDDVGHIMNLMQEKGIMRAPIVQNLGDEDEHEQKRSAEGYVGLLDLDTMILWFLQECDKSGAYKEDSKSHNEMEAKGFNCMVQQNHPLLQTKVGELAKLFLWDSFFPVYVDDSLFHVLLLLSKHRLQIVPVTKKSDHRIIGFVSQNAVIRPLLEASGLEWFDSIADKTLSGCRLQPQQVVKIHGDQSMVEAVRALWESRADSIAVVDSETENLIGSVRTSDVFLLFEDIDLYSHRKYLLVKDFIQLNTGMSSSQNSILPRMVSPVTNRESDTLKMVMKNMADSQSNISFLIDDCDRVQGLITLRDIVAQFAPPGIDSRMQGGGFFELALEQAGCQISRGTLQCDKKRAFS